MKIGIFTLPLNSDNYVASYGGILQAYALQNVLQAMGHEVLIINRSSNKFKRGTRDKVLDCLNIIKRCIFKIYYGKNQYITHQQLMRTINLNFEIFINNNFIKTSRIDSSNCLSFMSIIEKHNFEAIIVGSDQVWRSFYAPKLSEYFLDFLDSAKNESILRIAYAASFGTDDLDYTYEQQQTCQNLIRQFDAISVREESALGICKNKLLANNVVWVLDPTMLLDKEDYCCLFKLENTQTTVKHIPEHLVSYILDMNPNKKNILNQIAAHLNLPNYVINEYDVYDKNIPIKKRQKITIKQWMEHFCNAKYIITDSFHGCVFAIIFKKPFWVFINHKRGAARMCSLLKLFHLTDRVISDEEFNLNNLSSQVNWASVSEIINNMKDLSLNFLSDALKYK